MSAIGGIWRFDGAPVERIVAERMSNALAIFGPDRHGFWQTPERRLALIWRQYASLPEDIYDRQPVRSTDGVHVLVADARIDNIEDVAPELGLPDFRELPDAAILLAAYRKWGAASLDRLVGEFAFAIWNGSDRSLFLARDAVGYRPLYWARGKGFFGFATMPRGLFALPEVTRAIDEQNLAAQLALLPSGKQGTLYRDIHRVPPGHSMTITPDGQSARRYWEPLARGHSRFRDPRESAEALRAVYTTAVKCRLRGAGGIGSLISAGWDSASVTAIAARLLARSGGRMTSFTAVPREGFAGPTLSNRLADESEIAASVLRDFPNVEHVRVSSATRSHLAEIEAQSRFQDLPINVPINSVWLNRIAAEASRRGIRVLLAGDGGNFTVSYNGHGALPDLFRRGRWPTLARLLLQLSHRGFPLRWGLHRAIGPFLPLALFRLAQRAAGHEPAFDLFRDTNLSPEFASLPDIQVLAAERDWDLSLRPWADGRRMRLAYIGRIDSGHLRPATNARFGVDFRDPTLDRRLVELCLAIPEEHYLWQGRESAVFREAMAGLLPAWLLDKRTRGLQAADWYEGLVAAREELAAHVERLAGSRLSSRALDIARLRAVVAALPDPATPPEELANGNWGTLQGHRSHGVSLVRAATIGHFILRMENSNQ